MTNVQTPPAKRDQVTQDRIEQLHPAIRELVRRGIEEANSKLAPNIQVRIVQGTRTFPEQAALYAKGRTAPGPKVTNAKEGQSIHNYGLAIDFALLINGKEISWNREADADGDKTADWLEVVTVFLRLGFEWGGNWRTFKDFPHLEKASGNTWQILLKKYKAGQFIPGTKFVQI